MHMAEQLENGIFTIRNGDKKCQSGKKNCLELGLGLR